MKQETALAILKTGQNVFLTGQAGAGKTYVLNQYIEYLRVRQIPVAVTASTGIASTHMNGMTVHAWSGIGIQNEFEKVNLQRLAARDEYLERIKNTKVLIIDEISMLHSKQVDTINQVLKHFRKNEMPFGGVQVIFSGDFFSCHQLVIRVKHQKKNTPLCRRLGVSVNFKSVISPNSTAKQARMKNSVLAYL